MRMRLASRCLLGCAALLLIAGGTYHTWMYGKKAAAMIDASNLGAMNAAVFKGLWLSDGAVVTVIGLAYLTLAWQPKLGTRTLLAFLAALPLASAATIYATAGNFPPAHLLLLSGLMAIAAALLPPGWGEDEERARGLGAETLPRLP